jgi:hypothetical protein
MAARERVFAVGLVAAARAVGAESSSSCIPPVIVPTPTPVCGEFANWSVGLDCYRHDETEHWTLTCKLIPGRSEDRDWNQLERLAWAIIDAAGYPQDAPGVEPVIPIEEAHPKATLFWIWHSDGTDIHPIVADVMRGVASSLTPRDPQAVKPQTPRRNEPCSCGSGRKYKQCHGAN